MLNKLDTVLDTNVTIDVHSTEDNKLLYTIKKHNLVVQTGRNLVRDLLRGVAYTTGITYVAVGTGSTATVLEDTLLGTEVFRDTITAFTSSNSRLTVQLYLSSADANGSTLTEAGIFGNLATGTANSGTLFARVVHSPIVKTVSISVTYNWEINIS